jgi:hypothetical protein
MSVIVIHIVDSGFWLVVLSVDVGMKLVEPHEILLSYLGFYFLFV